jgi:dephospho-CoA kinase
MTPRPNDPMVIGVTGGIATGKSRVMQILRENGVIVFSADQAARAILTPGGQVLRDLAATFGADVLNPDGTLNRSSLGAKVFADPAARARLNELMHPPILRLLRAQIEAARTDFPRSLIAVEVPLLFEAGMERWFDRVLTVAASPAIQLARILQRDGVGEDEAQRRVAAQMPLEDKIRRSTDVIWNDENAVILKKRVKKCLSRWKQEGSRQFVAK